MDSGISPLLLFAAVLLLAADACISAFEEAVCHLPDREPEDPLAYDDTVNLAQAFTAILSAGILVPRGTAFIAGRFAISPAIALVPVTWAYLVFLSGVVIRFPARLGAEHPEGFYRALGPVVKMISLLLTVIRVPASAAASLCLLPFGLSIRDKEENVTESEIIQMVTAGHEQGVLEEDEAEMIHNIFELDDKEAADIMTHRTAIRALDAGMTLKEAVRYITAESNNSRYPVYQHDIDDIIGILHIRDVLSYVEQPGAPEKQLGTIEGILRKPVFIPETRKVDDIFREMQEQKNHMMIVVDEYGQTSGIVTMEDVLEEIVGNIQDEYDREENLVVKKKDGTFVISGMTPLEEAGEVLGGPFTEEDLEDYDTLNGFLIARLDRIPEDGERPEIRTDAVLYRVLLVKNKMIRRVLAIPGARKNEEPASSGNDEKRG